MSFLTLIIVLPLFAALLMLAIPSAQRKFLKYITLGVSLIELVLAVVLYPKISFNTHSLQLTEQFDWINLQAGNLGSILVKYVVAVDGLSYSLVLLSAIVLLLASICSWNIDFKEKGYFTLFLILSSSIYGCFLAQDFFLFFVFFEFMLLPMFFLIGIWGGKNREYASVKFFIYTLLGSVFVLLVMVGLAVSVIDPYATSVSLGLVKDASLIDGETFEKLYQLIQSGALKDEGKFLVHTTDMRYATDIRNYLPHSLFGLQSGIELFSLPIRLIGFAALMLGFLIKLPSVPFHTWLPDAHVEAPTPISVILAGILLKIGGYACIRLAYMIFPEGAIYFALPIAVMGVISIIYAAMNALAMRDLKKMIAYSSVSHMGFVLLGLSALTMEGVSGALMQQFSHGLISPMLFILVGVLYDRTHDRNIENYRGLASKMPQFTTLTVVAFFASLGLPGFSGFIAEIFVFLGSFNAASTNQLLPYWVSLLAALGVFVGAAYYLWTLQRMFFGKYWLKGGAEWNEHLKDVSTRELLMLVPLSILIVLFGVYPSLFFDTTSSFTENFVNETLHQGKINLEIITKSFAVKH